MRKGILLGSVLVSVLFVGVEYFVEHPEPKVVTKTEVQTEVRYEKVYMPDVKTQVVTKEVNKPVSKECKWFLEGVDDLMTSQLSLSAAKSDMDAAVKVFAMNVKTSLPSEAVDVEAAMNQASIKMNNAWNAIGTAQVDIERYEGSCD